MANLLDDYKYDGKQVPMAEVRVLHQSCGTQIRAIRSDTFKIFTPGLRENAERIRSIPPITESYGTHARHKVDIYQSHEHNTGREPLLVFLYAGGGTRGNRSLAVVPDNLVYNNLGTYFASRGITTLVPDYRRVDGKKGGDGAVSLRPAQRLYVAIVIADNYDRCIHPEAKILPSSLNGFRPRIWSQMATETYTYWATRQGPSMPPLFCSILSFTMIESSMSEAADLSRVR